MEKQNKTNGRFIKVACKKCKKETVTFDRATLQVKCECGNILTTPKGGKCLLKCSLKEEYKNE